MQTILLQTKLNFPAIREKRGTRPNLFARLEQGLARKLILVSIPAGFGKTHLLAGWVRNLPSGIRVGWLSLAERDNEIEPFLQYLAAALQAAGLDLGETTCMLGEENGMPSMVTQFLTEILNRLSANSMITSK